MWLYGVNPGAIAAHGESLEDAHDEFRHALKQVLVQFAAEASSFEEFKGEVERFFHATNEPTETEWVDALERVRRNREDLEGLPVRPADESPVSVTITLKQTFTPEDNRVEAELAEAA